MKTNASMLTRRMVSEFCTKRLAPVLPQEVVQTLYRYVVELLAREKYPPYRGAGLDLTVLAQTLSLDRALLQSQKAQLRSVFDAVARAVAEGRLRSGLPNRRCPATQGSAGQSSPPSVPRASGRRALGSARADSRARWSTFQNPCSLFGMNRTVSVPP